MEARRSAGRSRWLPVDAEKRVLVLVDLAGPNLRAGPAQMPPLDDLSAEFGADLSGIAGETAPDGPL